MPGDQTDQLLKQQNRGYLKYQMPICQLKENLSHVPSKIDPNFQKGVLQTKQHRHDLPAEAPMALGHFFDGKPPGELF